MGFDFKIPVDEKWVRQVMLNHAEDINEFIRVAMEQPARYRAFNVVTATAGNRVLITYEENLNARESQDTSKE